VRRGRLAVRIYLYTLSCVVVSVALFIVIAVAMRPRPIRMLHGPRGERVVMVEGLGGGAPFDVALWPPDLPPPPPPGLEPPPDHERRMISRVPPTPTKLFLVSGGVLVVIVLIASAAFARSLVRPLRRLEAAALAFGRGDPTARTGLDRDDEIGAAARAFDDMADRTTALMRSERELMANVSHELRTPLARMRVALDLAAEGDAETAREVTSEIDRDVTELEALIDAVLTSMQLDLAATSLRLEPITPDELARRAADRSRGLGHEHAVRVAAPPAMRPIEVDAVLVRRVLDNLIDNARKYSDPASPIDVRVSETDRTAVFEVEDRGIGIAAADLDQIFTPFFRADRSRQRGTGGVGLGLSLAHKIVAAHGGSITVRSTEGAGTVFRVELPSGRLA
jgi:two-component system OmpR family sensor kinase